MGELIHEAAIEKIAQSGVTGDSFRDAFRNLAKQAHDFGAANVEASLGYVENEEEVEADFVPEIVLRVRKPNPST